MKRNDKEYIAFERILKRGAGKVIEENENALFVYDSLSEGFFLACEDPESGMVILDKHDCNLLMVTDVSLGRAAYKKYGFSEKMECYQFVYYGDSIDAEDKVNTRIAEAEDIPVLISNYHLISPEEMKKVVGLGNVLLGYVGENLIGFIGEHLEGSMGLLYIFPEHRRKGYATALEKEYIRRTVEKGYVPFGMVEKDNIASIELQKSIGMTQSDNLFCWMWR